MEQEILGGAVVAIIAGFFGWCLSQITIGRKISESISAMNLTIQASNNEVHRAEDEIAALRVSIDGKITSISALVQEVLQVATKLIEVVRIQNELLLREHNKQK